MTKAPAAMALAAGFLPCISRAAEIPAQTFPVVEPR
jgi:hypothetical protein